MENESLTISKKPPAFKSMQYETLRELAVQHVQELAGKVWTDYNSHDPGVTMLEVFSYALTDLGYRTGFDIQDLLARRNPADPDPQNFYTAAQILPNRPLTTQDYRKLLIDTEVVDEETEGCRYAGVKNAWISKSDKAEEKIFVNNKESRLSLNSVSDETEKGHFYVKTLYEVLLEFDACEKFGDLNENTIEKDFVLYEHPPDDTLEGLRFTINITFPAWDNRQIDWQDEDDVRSMIRSIRVNIENLPDHYTIAPAITNRNRVILKGNKTSGATTSVIAGMTDIIDKLNAFLYQPNSGLLALYIRKVHKIFEIVDNVKARLHANRNLCEDFFRFGAVRVEEIIICSDIEIARSADVEQVEARIFHLISRFLSPSVHFYTLEEMRNKCRDAAQFSIAEINPSKRTITIEGIEKEMPSKDDIITVFGLVRGPMECKVHCCKDNPDIVNHFDIEVTKELPGNELQDDAYLIKGRFDEEDCFTVDQIFEGPLLNHGFIDNGELAAADRKKVIRVSDLINFIMDVEGVIAVRNIQIAHPPIREINEESKSVRWCLELVFEQDYVPRLNTERSAITYYKDNLPFVADDVEVKRKNKLLRAGERQQKIRYPKLDLPVPAGSFRNPADYTSIQEDFPLVYGVGSEGIPGLDKRTVDEREERKIQVKQLKGYLLLFDQFLANFLAQLANVKYLFTMNERIGGTNINKTYYSQSLVDNVPNGKPLYRDSADHKETLQQFTEDTSLFERRRNKFLNHLLGRYAENFADYAMLVAEISGPKAPRKLIDDKLNFLDQYPELSSGRGQAINYRDQCKIWHVDNECGLESRGKLLLGMAPKAPGELVFNDHFKIKQQSESVFRVVVEDGSSTVLLKANQEFSTDAEARAHLEQIITAGVLKGNYDIRSTEGGGFHFELLCSGEVLAASKKTDYADNTRGGDADTAIEKLVDIFKTELYENPEANRKNLACPLENYTTYEKISVDMSTAPDDPPTYTISYTLYKKAFDDTPEQELLTGSVTRDAETDDTEAQVRIKAKEAVHKVLWDLINHGAHRSQYSFDSVSGSYSFLISSRCGETIAQSVESNFNKALAEDINADASSLSVAGSTANDGEYDIINASVNGPRVTIEVDPIPRSAVFDGYLMMDDFYDLSFVDQSSGNIILNKTEAEIYKGDTVRLTHTESSDGFYTVQSIRCAGNNMYLKVEEPIAQDETQGRLRKAYSMVEVSNDGFVIKGGKDEQAVMNTIKFIEDKFFFHEGFHVLEHVLLRPRTNERLFVDITQPVLDDTVDPLGTLAFWKAKAVLEVDAEANTFMVAGDIEAQVAGEMIRIEGSNFNDGSYEIREITGQNGNSVIKVKTVNEENAAFFDWPDDTESYEGGALYFQKKTSIDSVSAAAHEMVVSDTDAANLAKDSIVEILESAAQKNDGRYKVSLIEEESGQVTITVYKAEELVEDRLLPIHVDQDCASCQISDPYSNVASVVVPYWPGRFINMDYRKFVEKRLRLEAPAHVLLNICWISCEHMSEFEEKYKKWLIATNAKAAGPQEVSAALSELIDISNRMRNVYSTGTLHDCKEDDTLEGAVILNQTTLGTFQI